ncbi:hypothetical protein AB0A91_33170 [Streptomyces sp. NPDC042207]|uniref:hypothetical protein n=1 Tax=Streptomyces sp. NPDC042207 TaxID=3154331 RepID=UPI0033C87803
MQQLPTSAATADPKTARALAAIEAAKRDADQDVAECLDLVADMVKTYRDPDVVFDRILAGLRRESLQALAAVNGLRLFYSSQQAVTEGTVRKLVAFWPSFAILPHGQDPADSIAQLRAAIAEREDEQQRAAAFQASVADQAAR